MELSMPNNIDIENHLPRQVQFLNQPCTWRVWADQWL